MVFRSFLYVWAFIYCYNHHMTKLELTNLVMTSFEAERTSDTQAGLALLHPDFKVVEMNIGPNGSIFASLTGKEVRALISEAFQISDRQYQFISTVADESAQTVVIEFIESYADTNSGQRFRTPIVAICEIRDGLIYRTRHYCDPRLSHEFLDQVKIDEALA